MAKPSGSFGFLNFMNILFALFVEIDSIVHFAKAGSNMDDDNSKYVIIIMCFRFVAAGLVLTVSILDMTIGDININLKIISTWIYAIFMVVLLYLSAIVIKYQWNSLSLIVALCSSYLGCGVGLKLLIFRYVEERDDNEKGRANAVESTASYAFRMIDSNLLALGTMLTVVLALTIGILMKEMYPDWNQRSVKYVGFPGEIFLRILKCLILPLIFSSLVFAMGNLDTKLSGKIGLRTVIYYLATTVIAIILGIILVLTIKPGSRGEREPDDYEPESNPIATEDTILDLIRNLFPENLIEACFQTFRTSLVVPSNTTGNESSITNDSNKYDWEIKSGYTTGSNILGIVVFAITFGVIIGYMNEDGKVLLEFFRSFNNAMMIMTEVVIQITPIAVLFLVLPQVLNVDSISDLLGSVGWYTITTIIGLLIHGIIILPFLYFIFTRKNPYTFLSQMSAAIMTAFGTASSSATMPVTLQCIEERNHIDKRISRFCIPVGATINMDGTALYEAVAAIFIAQYNDWPLEFSEVVIISITATAASIGAAGIPQAGLITMVIVLNAVGLPAEYAALIYIVDWLIDRFRTAINVLGDAIGCGIVAQLSIEDLKTFQLPDSAFDSNGINGIQITDSALNSNGINGI